MSSPLTLFSSGGMTLEEWVRKHLSIAEQSASLNAFVHLFSKEAIEDARRIDKEVQAGRKPGKLYGIIISVKDNICIAGRPVTAASKILEGYVSPFSATAIQRLLAEDAIILGTTNCDEFGMGSDSTKSNYGPVRNGKDPLKVAGGSSGGAAVSVQCGACHLAIGTDTGGSIRQPAAFCDLAGFKPGYGKISRHGLIAYASSFDQLGFIAHDTELIRLCYDICKGPDSYDGTVSSTPDAADVLGEKPRLVTFSNIFPEHNDFIQKCWRLIRTMGKKYKLKTIPLDTFHYLVPTYYILTTAEASSNLSRYDGVRFGMRADNISSLDEMYKKTRTLGFGSEVKKRIMLGTFVLSEGYFEAYYTQAQKVRQKIRQTMLQTLSGSDFIILPVTASEPWDTDYKSENALEMYYADVYTVLASLAGLPAISVPVKTQEGIINIQLVAAPNNEHKLLYFSSIIQNKFC